ncbi:hypothetical protein D1007_22866 [Hordeum vulgare]|nr:hypothetical protein D1007_22866 [Hordeum vulgare]
MPRVYCGGSGGRGILWGLWGLRWKRHTVGMALEHAAGILSGLGNHGEVPLRLNKPTTEYFGSATVGPGFYHIDIPVSAESNWLNYKNCAILKVLKGEVSAFDLIIQLNGIFCKGKEWP